VLAGRADALDLPRLARWAAARQSWAEGGFNGRTNKLVDGCYSFWQGALFALLQRLGLGQLSQMQVRQAAALEAEAEAEAEAAAAVALLERSLASTRNSAPDPAPTTGADRAAFPLQVPDVPAGSALAAARAGNPLLRIDLRPPQPPEEQAARAVEVRLAAQAAARQAALDASEAVHTLLEGSSARTAEAPSAQARGLMHAAHKAQQSLEAALHNRELLGASAAQLVVLAQEPLPAVEGLDGGSGGGGGGSGDDAEGGAAGVDAGTRQLLQVAAEKPALRQRPSCLMDSGALQLWLLCCCQMSRGGLRDKPGKSADYYHTCYCLSGLAAAQQAGDLVLGDADNALPPADPACNVLRRRLEQAWRVFDRQPLG
jgi:protein farnesyltransferase subunit beta